MMMVITTQTTAKQMFRVNVAKEMNELIQYIKQCEPQPEPVAVKIDDVDVQEGVVHIEPSKPGTKTKMVMNTHELSNIIGQITELNKQRIEHTKNEEERYKNGYN
eukprot:114599_1